MGGVFSEGLLAEMDGEMVAREAAPFEGCAEKEVGVSHEVDLDSGGEDLLESFFFFLVFREEDEVIDVETNKDGLSFGWGRWVGCHAREETRVMFACDEAHVAENASYHVVPVLGRTTDPIESLFESPIGSFFCVRISDGGSDNGDFVLREDSIEKCVFAVSLLEGESFFNRTTCEKVKGRVGENGCKSW